MEFIIDFYTSLDTLNLIIFWGIIIVIILLIIFSSILINKNKKIRKTTNTNKKQQDELPIKKEKMINDDNEKELIEEKTIDLPIIHEMPKEQKTSDDNKIIETEKKFIAEEHVIEYNNDLFSLSNIKKTNEHKEENNNYEAIKKTSIEMPTGPYQRNVLREMSLSQTSPIGITKPIHKQDKKEEMVKDLENSLNSEDIKTFPTRDSIKKEELQSKTQPTNEEIKKELINIENLSPRRTEIRTERQMINRPVYEEKKGEKEEVKSTLTKISNSTDKELNNKEILKRPSQIIRENQKNEEVLTKVEIKNEISTPQNSEESHIEKEEIKTSFTRTIIPEKYETPAKELLNIEPQISKEKTNKTSSERYLEEVSRKLAEAEIPDEIERTNYELKQEEDAIISYKELMEKKDSIQTIDEEEAVISIEELMNRSNQKQEVPEEIKEETKLYKLSEEEANDDFLKELKQFRNDL